LITAAAAEGRGDADGALSAASKAMDIMEHGPLLVPMLAEFIWIPALRHRLTGLVRGLPEGEWKQILSFACDGRYAEAADVLTDVGAAAIAARTHLFAAGAARDDGRRDDVKRHAADALRFYSEVGATRFAERAAALMHA
jgi:hypothetical protein